MWLHVNLQTNGDCRRLAHRARTRIDTYEQVRARFKTRVLNGSTRLSTRAYTALALMQRTVLLGYYMQCTHHVCMDREAQRDASLFTAHLFPDLHAQLADTCTASLSSCSIVTCYCTFTCLNASPV